MASALVGSRSTNAQTTIPGGATATNATSLIDKYRKASDKALAWLLPRLREDGSFGPEAVEMTCYHKAVYLFGLAGEISAANRMLTHIKRRYMQSDFDFKLSPQKKADKVNYNELTWGYTNGWFALAAHRLGRFDISYPAYQYLKTLYHPETGGFTSTRPGDEQHPIIELLATAHIGMLALYLGDRDKAHAAARLVQKFEEIQPEPDNGFYLRMASDSRLIVTYPEEETGFYFLNATAPGQFYFMTGYPAAFLATMHLLTGKEAYLKSADRYFRFSAGTKGVYESHFSHKLAWGASLLYRITGEQQYRDLATRVADFMLSIQDENGAWFADQPPYVSYDQSAECGIWLRTISAELAAAPHAS